MVVYNTLKRIVGSSPSNNKWFLIGKVFLPFIFLGVLVWQLFYKVDFPLIWTEFIAESTEFRFGFLFMSIVLVPVNWFLEGLKWKLLTDHFQEIGPKQVVKSIVSGICLSIITPHRVGEYAGRLVGIEKKNHWKAVFSTAISGFAQNIIILLIGLISSSFLIHDLLEMTYDIKIEMFVITGVVTGLLLFFLFRIDVLVSIVQRWKILKNKSNFINGLAFLRQIPSSVINQILGLALLRYIVYSFQFLLIIYFFQMDIPPLACFGAIGMIFLIQSGIPLPAIANLLARTEIAFLILSYWSVNELAVVSSTLLLWIINLLIPALIGLIVIEKEKLRKEDV